MIYTKQINDRQVFHTGGQYKTHNKKQIIQYETLRKNN